MKDEQVTKIQEQLDSCIERRRTEAGSRMEKHITTILVSLITAGIIYVGFSVTTIGGEIRLLKYQFSTLQSELERDRENYVRKEEFRVLEQIVEHHNHEEEQ